MASDYKITSGISGGSAEWDSRVMDALALGRQGAVDDPALGEMRKNRRVNRLRARTGQLQSGSGGNARGGGDISFASGRPQDPLFYWKQNNLPYDASKPEELKKIRAYARLLYMTHPLIASCIDIFSKYPLTGMEFVCKDKEIAEFYTSLFFDQLGYEDFLIDLGREYWTVGEAWPLGSFNETLGVWEDDELLNPDHIEVVRSPFLKEPRFLMQLPDSIREIIEKRSPKWEFEALMRSYPELKNFLGPEAKMPVSNILLKQLRFKADTFNPRGIPILMRGFRSIFQEEMLNAAQDAIASRLYTPLILARLGASASDLGTSIPWVPTDDQIDDFEDSLDAALAADFRVLTTHFAVQMDSVFGRENMPNLDPDFQRLGERQLQVFGLSQTMLSGASSGETYAADALNRDLVTQLLTTYQRLIKNFVKDRCLVVAEAQGHVDYEERGGKRYPAMEEVLEVDEETGEQRIVEQPKLLVPDLKIKAMNMKDEQDLRQFLEAMVADGVPISRKTRLVNVPVDLEEEAEAVAKEQVDMAVRAQEVRKETYLALKARRLPIPEDLIADFQPMASDGTGDKAAAQEQPLPDLGLEQPAPTMALQPVPEDYAQAQEPGLPAPAVTMLPRNVALDPGRTRPPESDEQRAGMPTAASLRRITVGDEEMEVLASEAEVIVDGEPTTLLEGRGRLLSGPRHVGMRRHSILDKNKPLDQTDDPPEAEAS